MPIRIPDISYSADRDQYNAEVLVEKIMEEIPNDAEKLLGMVDVDLFVPGLNFVFGLAVGNTAVISLARLRSEKNEYVFRERALKEAIHELSHTFGFQHCQMLLLSSSYELCRYRVLCRRKRSRLSTICSFKRSGVWLQEPCSFL